MFGIVYPCTFIALLHLLTFKDIRHIAFSAHVVTHQYIASQLKMNIHFSQFL